MKNLIKLLLIVPMILVCCERREGFDAGGPISSYLLGKWKLEKIVSKSQTKVGSQIGYLEVIESGNDKTNNYDKVFRADTLFKTYIWSRNENVQANTEDMTVLVNYVGGSKRFFKIYKEKDKPTTLEASGYVSKIGDATQDTVKYYYSKL